MANGLSDILGAYREGLASERQVRTSEMQMSLSQLQYESENRFREEGRNREDAFRGLTLANQSMKESAARDASSIYSLMSGVQFIERDSDNKLKKLRLSKAEKAGFNEKEARDIYNMVLMYESESPQLQQQAQFAATNIGKLVSAYKDSWDRTGDQPDYLKALSNAGVLYAGDEVNGEVVYDKTKFGLSYEPFVNVSKATDVLANISDEFNEMASGDYEIQRGIGIDRTFTKEQSSDDVVRRTADMIESLLKGGQGGGDAVLSSISNLQSQVNITQGKIDQGFEGLDDELSSLTEKLTSLKALEQSKNVQDRSNEVSDLANDILANAGVDNTKKNIQVATDQALRILGAESASRTVGTPFLPNSISGLEEYPYFSGKLKKSGEPNIPYE